MNEQENKQPMTEKERKKAQRRETRTQAWFALRAVLSAYLVYLGYDLIRKTVTSEENLGIYFYVYIAVGIVFDAVGIFILLNCWKMKKARDKEEREAQRAEMEAKGLLNFDEKSPAAAAEDEDWGYRPEGDEAEEPDTDNATDSAE